MQIKRIQEPTCAVINANQEFTLRWEASNRKSPFAFGLDEPKSPYISAFVRRVVVQTFNEAFDDGVKICVDTLDKLRVG